MRRIVGLAVLISVAVIIFGCASDIILKEDVPLKGNYKGRYSITTLGTPQPVERDQVVNWTFDDKNFFMKVDVDSPFLNENFCIYNCGGPYLLAERVQLRVLTAKEPGFEGCDSRDVTLEPNGDFSLERSQDTLKLTYQDNENNYLKVIILTPVTE